MSNQLDSPLTCIGLVFGGKSGEHNISIQSARTVASALKTGSNVKKFSFVPIYIDEEGRWWPEEIAEQALKKGFALKEEDLPTSLKKPGFQKLPRGSEKVEIWFPILHGPNGEDGTVQGLFKLTGKPFVGSGVLGSAIGMDKIAMKAAFSAAGINQVPYCTTEAMVVSDPKKSTAIIKKIETIIGYPCFIKPANMGSSVGITKACNRNQLLVGLKTACKFDNRLVIEKAVKVRELECAALGTVDMQTSAVGEVRFKSDWYDYQTKYSDDSTLTIIPAPIPNSIRDKIQKLTLQACEATAAIGLARVDFFYDEEKDEVWINEINTLPGFTKQSMFPLLWESIGLSLEDLVAKLLDTARE